VSNKSRPLAIQILDSIVDDENDGADSLLRILVMQVMYQAACCENIFYLQMKIVV
jgi:hypothetical protein